jgi:GT2 family glycosyltransferase
MSIESSENKPLVSVLILTWNRRTEVGRSIESAMAQTYRSVEVVVVDNGSTDGTSEFLQTQYPHVRVVRLAENVGCPSGRNAGFGHCSGRYIYQLDDDGWLKEDAIEIAVARAESDAAIAVVMSRIHEVDANGIGRKRPPRADTPAFVAHFSGGCSMMRRDALERCGVYPDDFFRQGEESDLALRLFDHGYLCVLEPESVMYHRPSPVGRVPKTFLYYTLRNTNKTALRLWPLPWVILRPLVNVAHALRGAMVFRYWGLPVAVLRELLRDLRKVHLTRRPISRRAFRMARTLQAKPAIIVRSTGGSIHTIRPLR